MVVGYYDDGSCNRDPLPLTAGERIDPLLLFVSDSEFL